MATVPGALIWEIVKKNNCFLVKEFGNRTAKIQFSKESNNLYNTLLQLLWIGKLQDCHHNRNVTITGKDNSVVLATTKTRKQNKPAALQHKTVLKKKFPRMAKAVSNQEKKTQCEVGANYYRPDLRKAALARLSFVNRSLQVAKSGVKKKTMQATKIPSRK